MKELEKQYKALANRKRLLILKFLKHNHQGSVGDIAGEVGLTLKATSKHLGILSAVDIVDKTKQGMLVYYRLAEKPALVFKHLLSQI